VLVTIIEESLSGLRIIKAFNIEPYRVAQFGDINESLFGIHNKIKRRQQLSSPLSEFMGITVVATVLWFGGRLVLEDSLGLSPEAFITYIVIFSQIISPAKSFSTAYYNIRKGMASAERIVKVLDADIKIKEPSNPKTIDGFNSSIKIKDVCFSYDKQTEVLKNIDLEIKKGQCVALVGPSGAGKTTLVDLIPRFYDIDKGTVEIDGHNIKSLALHSLREQIGFVSQQSVLFNDTIYNNIALGVENVSLDEVEAAAKLANAHEFIIKLDGGYQSNIGDQGNKLSGGQKQRLTIARAILRNPPILILDEATSALDTESEKLVQDALIKLMKDRTSIVIAHRLSTVKHADNIIVLKDGQIKERGTHQDLLSLGEIYDNLVKLQSIN
jgi:subfamily B ATP-binding cassette protein MsbA